ncbi:MAG: SEC-C domain-containing protein [Candidatus Zixiibacteriota bacterium]|nr:MAG: SEC-C domain-containing protein [candidate division Zixibacteria bacterium]
MFTEMLRKTDEKTVEQIFKGRIAKEETSEGESETGIRAVHQSALGMGYAGARAEEAPAPEKQKPIRVQKQPGRNDPCPCGSGEKYKRCCLDKNMDWSTQKQSR